MLRHETCIKHFGTPYVFNQLKVKKLGLKSLSQGLHNQLVSSAN